MKLGISSYTYGWAVGVPGYAPSQPLDEQGLLDKALDHGVRLLQIGDNLPLHTFDEARLDHLGTRAARAGIQLEIGARGLTQLRITEYARIARRLGANLLRFVIDDASYQPNAETVTATLRAASTHLAGLQLGLENHDRFPAATLRRMIETAGCECYGVCLDTANSLGAGEGLETALASLAPLTINLHIKDYYIERVPCLMGFSVTGRPAGMGALELPRLLEHLNRFGRCETAVLELWTPPEARLEETIEKESLWAHQSLDYLRPFFTT